MTSATNKPGIEEIDFHGTPALRLNGPNDTSAVISKLGAQLLSWIAADGRERLFVSKKAIFDGSVPIRGGVPVCFPQFAGQGSLPKHGFVRTRQWDVEAQRAGDDYALLTLTTSDDAASRAHWPHAFKIDLTVMLEADRLDIEFGVDNTGDAPFSFTGALHTYLRVVQVEDVTVEGTYGVSYEDKLTGEVKKDSGTHVSIEAETDRIYRHVTRPLMLKAGNLTVGIQSDGFPDAVIWNPWVEGCARVKDMEADDWRRMLCIEAAVASQPVVVAPGESWSGRQSLVPL
ncbi:MAG: D-hexose-6-phosphate mutarotase [Zoogloeaceae bacterium]|nr:D-hexose-6-phosphate mutarotase [Zoogloeaceae bacterium]